MAVGKVHEAYDCRVGRATVLGRIDRAVRAGVQIPRSRLDVNLRLACSVCETGAVGRKECDLYQ